MIHMNAIDDARVPIQPPKHRVRAFAISGVLVVSAFAPAASQARMVGHGPHRMVGSTPHRMVGATPVRMVGRMVG